MFFPKFFGMCRILIPKCIQKRVRQVVVELKVRPTTHSIFLATSNIYDSRHKNFRPSEKADVGTQTVSNFARVTER